MKKISLMHFLPCLVLIGSCGSSDTVVGPINPNVTQELRVLSSSPDNGAISVSTSSPIQVTFNQAVDPNSLIGNLNFYETSGENGDLDLTSQMEFSLISPNVLQVKPLSSDVSVPGSSNKLYRQQARYMLLMSQGIKDSTNRLPLRAQTHVIIDTGLGGTTSNIIKASQPKVIDVDWLKNCGCKTLIMTTDETMHQMVVKIRDRDLVKLQRAPYSKGNVWGASFCDFGFLERIRVEVDLESSIDLNGQKIVDDHKEGKDSLLDFSTAFRLITT